MGYVIRWERQAHHLSSQLDGVAHGYSYYDSASIRRVCRGSRSSVDSTWGKLRLRDATVYNPTVASATRDAALAKQHRPNEASRTTVRTEAEREVDGSISTVHAPVSDILCPRGPLGARSSAAVAQYSMDRRSVDHVTVDRGRVGSARARTPRGCERG